MQLQKYYFFKKVPSVRRNISLLKLTSFGKNYYIWLYLCVCVCVCVCVRTRTCAHCFFVTSVWYTFINGDALDKYYKLRTSV